MVGSRSDQLAAGAGIVGAALLVAGFVLVGVDAPGSDATRGEIVATYADDATGSRQAAGVLLTALGGLCLLPFVAHVRGAVARTAREGSVLPAVALAGGILLVGGVLSGAILSSAVSAGGYFDAQRVDADLAMTTVAAGYYFYGFAAMAGGLLIAALAITGSHGLALPRWLTLSGLVVAAASVPAALLGMWVLVEAVWLAVAAALFLRRGAVVREADVRVSGHAGVHAHG